MGLDGLDFLAAFVSVTVGWGEVGWVFWLFLCCCQSEMDVVGWVFWLLLFFCQSWLGFLAVFVLLSKRDGCGWPGFLAVFVLMGEFGRIFCLLLCCCQKLTVSGQEQDG